MSDQTPTPAPAEETTPTVTDPAATDPAGDPPGDEQLGEGGKKALENERTARKEAEKRAKDAEAKVAEFERANMTELEKAQAEAKDAGTRADRAAVDAFREAAVAFGGIDAEDAELFLTGSDVETLKKQAERLVSRTPKGPKPDPSQGSGGQGGPKSTADLFASAIEDAFQS